MGPRIGAGVSAAGNPAVPAGAALLGHGCRAQLRRVLARLDSGDVLMVTLARSTGDLLNTLAAIASKGAGFPLLQPKRGAVNPHATFCGNRSRATASGDPVGSQQ